MNVRSTGLDPSPPNESEKTPVATRSHLVGRAIFQELQSRSAVLENMPDLRSFQVTVKLDPVTGSVRGVWSTTEAGGYRR